MRKIAIYDKKREIRGRPTIYHFSSTNYFIQVCLDYRPAIVRAQHESFFLPAVAVGGAGMFFYGKKFSSAQRIDSGIKR